MTARLLDGRALALKLQIELKAEVDLLRARTGVVPRLMNITIGQDAGAGSYGKSQQRAADAIGIDYRFLSFPQTVTWLELGHQIQKLNVDPSVHGIMLHKPFPDGIDFRQAIESVDPRKDIEGMNSTNLGRLMLGQTKIIPCTPAAAMALLLSAGEDIAGKKAVVVGRSDIVGKPLMLLLLEKNATVTVCHSGTSKAGRLAEEVAGAEILVAAMGKPGFIKGEWIRPGALVIDVGINAVNGKIVGDIAYDAAVERASFITPVPGGVGPVTAVMLMKNGIEAFKNLMNIS